ncbi:MAG TPA: sulfite exporter TauE/SafE family protein [Thermoleophilaceae bacterium]
MDFALVAFGLAWGHSSAIGTDLAHAAVTKTVGGYKHWKQRTVDLTLSTWMAIGSVPAAVFGVYVLTLLEDWLGDDFDDGVIVLGSVPGVWLGSHWSVRVDPAVLRLTLAVVLIGAGLALLIKAGLGIPIGVIIPFPLAVIGLLIVTMIRSRKARAEVGT